MHHHCEHRGCTDGTHTRTHQQMHNHIHTRTRTPTLTHSHTHTHTHTRAHKTFTYTFTQARRHVQTRKLSKGSHNEVTTVRGAPRKNYPGAQRQRQRLASREHTTTHSCWLTCLYMVRGDRSSPLPAPPPEGLTVVSTRASDAIPGRRRCEAWRRSRARSSSVMMRNSTRRFLFIIREPRRYLATTAITTAAQVT